MLNIMLETINVGWIKDPILINKDDYIRKTKFESSSARKFWTRGDNEVKEKEK